MTLTIHPPLVPKLKKEYSYTSSPRLGLHGVVKGKLYVYTPCTFLHILLLSHRLKKEILEV